MKLKAGMIVDAFTVLTTIINEKRPMTPKAGYRVARLHDKLERDARVVQVQHDNLVRELGEETFHEIGDGEAKKRIPTGHKVKDENMEEFQKRWAEIAGEEVEVDVQPLPLEVLGDNGGILPNEFKLLGPLVAE
jgi:hypothetical protein